MGARKAIYSTATSFGLKSVGSYSDPYLLTSCVNLYEFFDLSLHFLMYCKIGKMPTL